MKKIILILLFSLFVFSCSKQEEQIVKVEKIDNKPKTILALWDSLTAWYGVGETENYPYKLWKKLEENWYKYNIVNAWVSWDTSANLKSRASLYLENKPDLVILVIWWNDWLRGLSVDDMKQNILDIIDMYEKNWIKIVLCWMDVPANLWLNYKDSFKKVYKEIAKERKKVYFYEFFLDRVAWIRMLNTEDMIHPNSSWYDIIVDKLFAFLEDNKLLNK
jgi:acyl-CoA thioesterase-1